MAYLAGGDAAQLLNNLNQPAFRQQHAMDYRARTRENATQADVNNFLTVYMQGLFVGQAVATLAWWQAQYPGEVVGGVMAMYALWLYFFRAEGHVGAEPIFANYLRNALVEFNRLWPGLNAGLYDYFEIFNNSQHFRNATTYLKGTSCGKRTEHGKIWCCTKNDIRRLALSIAQEPHGYRLIAWCWAVANNGERAEAMLLTMPSSGMRMNADGRWKFNWRPVKNDQTRSDRETIFDQETSDALTQFNSVRDMGGFVETNNFFCMPSAEANNSQMDHQFQQCGFPVRQFANKSMRACYVTTNVCNLILNGTPKNVAITQVNNDGGWAPGNESIKPYLDEHMVALSVRHANNPNITSLDNFNFLDVHPEFLRVPNLLVPHPVTNQMVLRGPWRAKRFCANSGMTPALRTAMTGVWTLVRSAAAGDPVNMPANWGTITRFIQIGVRLFNHPVINLPANWQVCMTDLRHTYVGAPVAPNNQDEATGTLTNVMFRNKVLTVNGCQNNNIPAVPNDIANNFALFQMPPNYQPPAKALREVLVRNSVDLPSLRKHILNRQNARVIHIVAFDGQNYPLRDLSNAQAVLYKQTNGRCTPQQWLAAAMVPDPP